MTRPQTQARVRAQRRLAPALRPPSGIFMLSYLRRSRSPLADAHRALFLAHFRVQSRRQLIRLIAVEAIRWTLWVSWTGWKTSVAVVDASGPAVRDDVGASLSRQRRQVLRSALLNNLPPRDYYRHRLFVPSAWQARWEFVFDNEATAFHRSRNLDGPRRESIDLLSDKLAFERSARAAGLCVAETLAVLPIGSSVRDLPAGAGPLFCKPRTASGSSGAFRLDEAAPGRWLAQPIGRRPIDAGTVHEFIDRRLGAAEYLLQPRYESHPGLHDLGGSADEAVTLRMITEARTDTIATSCAFLEIPASSEAHGYVPVTVDSVTGSIGAVVEIGTGTDAGTALTVELEKRRAEGLDLVPCWREAQRAAVAAHRLVPDVFAVAWDFVVSPRGPVLLEGNSTWSTIVPQRICGPFLAASED